ncbi:MAG TPA: hypothetical protein VG148_07655 [Pyrinomonadaceae bacterium]|nr:hypothetical protein [Pyrinomonadaceae bacterium]
MGRKKHEADPLMDDERLLADVRSPDGEVRGEAVRSLCPCHAGWEAFERHVAVVLRATRDRDRAVRAHALHVFEDAARMQLRGELDYRLHEVAEMVRRKRASRFRPEEEAAEARRLGKVRRLAERYRRWRNSG